MRPFRYEAFGLRIASAFELPGLRASEPAGVPDVNIRMTDVASRRALEAHADEIEEWILPLRGGPFRIARDTAGGYRFSYGHEGAAYLVPGGGSLTCDDRSVGSVLWTRELLDTVLHSVALIHGFQMLHCSAVRVDAGVVAFLAASGSGKTTLAAELMRGGCELFTDDVLALDRHDPRIVHPGPGIMSIPTNAVSTTLRKCPGRVLADFGDESWVALESHCSGPRPLAALFILERGAALGVAATRIGQGPRELVQHALGLGGERDKRLVQVMTYAHLASVVPVYRLSAPLTAGPERLARAVRDTVSDHSTRQPERQMEVYA